MQRTSDTTRPVLAPRESALNQSRKVYSSARMIHQSGLVASERRNPAASCRVPAAAARWSRQVASRIPWLSSTGSSPRTTQSRTIAGVTSGWNWTPRWPCRVNASGPSAPSARTRASRGGLTASSRQTSHGPGTIQRGTELATLIQPRCGRTADSEPPPSATASAWAPDPMPSTDVPTRSASRSQSNCASDHVRATSPALPSDPSATASRIDAGSGNGSPKSGRTVLIRNP